MIEISVTIEGTKPILFHNPAAMLIPKSTKAKDRIPTAEAEAEAGCYWNSSKTSLIFPASNLHRAIIAASTAYKDKRRSVAPYIAGSVEISPEELSFGTTNYEIFIKRVVVQRAAVMRARPMLRKWKLSFSLLIDDQDIPPAIVGSLLPILEEAGRRIGIGDFRVGGTSAKGSGPFGKFKVVGWDISAHGPQGVTNR